MCDCIFCKIASGEIPSDKVYESENIIIIKDLNPQAKVHLLIIPKKHYENLEDAAKHDPELVGKMFNEFATVREKLGLDDGYRFVSNKGKFGCQSVNHLHVHVLGGEQLSEKMS